MKEWKELVREAEKLGFEEHGGSLVDPRISNLVWSLPSDTKNPDLKRFLARVINDRDAKLKELGLN